MTKPFYIMGFVLSLIAWAPANAQYDRLFARLLDLDWQESFYDPCTDDWRKLWFLDGQKAEITHSRQGMDFRAGPVPDEHASHAVLWTKETFSGDLKIEFEYQRLDDAVEYVNILYIQATGSGEGSHAKNIATWSTLRQVPTMSQYFGNMNLYHISFSAFKRDNRDPGADYIRARRYLPETGRLKGTAFTPDYFRTGFFQSGVRHKITVVKSGTDLFMQVEAEGRTGLYHWDTSIHPPITEGRIGLRHMSTRSARYREFRVFTRGQDDHL